MKIIRRTTGPTLAMIAVATLASYSLADAPSGQAPAADLGVRVIAPRPHRLPNAQAVTVARGGHFVAGAFGGPSTGRFPLQPRDGCIVVWETDTGRKTRELGVYGDVVQIQFADRDRTLVYARVWTPGDSVEMDVTGRIDLAADDAGVHRWNRAVSAASPVDDTIVIARGPAICERYVGSDLADADVSQPGRPLQVENGTTATGLRFSPQGNLLAALYRVRVGIVRDGRAVANAYALRREGLAIVDADAWTLQRATRDERLHDATALSVSPGGKWIATGHAAGVVRVWDGASLALVRELRVPTEAAVCPEFSPAGDTLVAITQPANSPTWRYANTPSGFEFGRQQVGAACELIEYDTHHWRAMRRFRLADGAFRTHHADRPAASLNPRRIAFSPDGKQVLVGANGVTLLDLETGAVVRQFDCDAKTQ